MRTVTRLEPSVPAIRELKKVAAYCRVSRDSERLMHSLSAQVSHYSELIQKNPEWVYAGVYADEGISGTRADKRDEFSRMIDDCKAGKCVMRLGNASGKRFVTGGVLEGGNGGQLAIPKTRRIEQVADDDGEFVNLLGFVKLTVIG